MTTRDASRPTTDTDSSTDTIATRWQDLALGARLAVNGGRAGWLRLTLTAVGIGLCTAVLLLAASLGPALDSRSERAEASTPQYLSPSWLPLQDSQEPASPAAPGSFEVHDSAVPYRGMTVNGWDLTTRPENLGAAPPPPGVEHFPAPGELLVSPALAELLDSAEGEDLLTRVNGRVSGTIARSALLGPDELRFYRGAAPSATAATRSTVATGWGLHVEAPPETTDEYLPALLLAGTTVVIVPLLIFVALMSRLGGPARDRRSATIRLLGASSTQVRRITLVETGLAAACGLLIGGLGYLLARESAPLLHIGAAGFFPADLSPAPMALVANRVVRPCRGHRRRLFRRAPGDRRTARRCTGHNGRAPPSMVGPESAGRRRAGHGRWAVLRRRGRAVQRNGPDVSGHRHPAAVRCRPVAMVTAVVCGAPAGWRHRLATRRSPIAAGLIDPSAGRRGDLRGAGGAIALQPLITLLGSDRTGSADLRRLRFRRRATRVPGSL